MTSNTYFKLFDLQNACMKQAHCDTLTANRIVSPIAWWFSSGRACGPYEVTFWSLDGRQLAAIARRIVPVSNNGFAAYGDVLEPFEAYIDKKTYSRYAAMGKSWEML